MIDYLPMDTCQHRHLYLLNARHLSLGVYDTERKGFIGIREKFGRRFLDIEFHWDTGAPFGTACPVAEVGTLPDTLEAVEGTADMELRVFAHNDALFTYLDEVELATNEDR